MARGAPDALRVKHRHDGKDRPQRGFDGIKPRLQSAGRRERGRPSGVARRHPARSNEPFEIKTSLADNAHQDFHALGDRPNGEGDQQNFVVPY